MLCPSFYSASRKKIMLGTKTKPIIVPIINFYENQPHFQYNPTITSMNNNKISSQQRKDIRVIMFAC